MLHTGPASTDTHVMTFCRQSPRAESVSSAQADGRALKPAGSKCATIAVVLAAAAVIVAMAVALVQDYRAAQWKSAASLLESSMTDCAFSLETWLSDGFADVEITAAQSGIAERYRRWMMGQDKVFPRLLQNRIDADRRIRGYASVAFLKPDGSVFVQSSDARRSLTSAQASSLIERAVLAGGPIFEDHFHASSGDWFVAWASPVRESAETTPVGFMVYTTSMGSPARSLIGRRRLPFTSGVIALSRHHDGGSGELSSANDFDLLISETPDTVKAALAEGLRHDSAATYHGPTDEGVPVLAAAHTVPGAPWMVSATVDAAEIDAPVFRYGSFVALAALFLITALMLGAGMLWRARDQRYRERLVLLDLEEALSVRDRFLTNMSHELRTPLQSIMGFTSMMLSGLAGPLNEEQQRQLTMVDSSSKRLLAMVDDVLDVSRAGAGRLPVSVSEFTADEVEAAICGMMSPLIERKQIACTPYLADPGLTLRTDREMVERIILNLVSNAIKFTDEGFVNMSIHADGPDHVAFSIVDSGRGIPADQLERVMEEFHQVVEPGGVKPVGTGLGLAISRRMAEALGGTLTCRSEVGQGSTFTLRIPRVYRMRDDV